MNIEDDMSNYEDSKQNTVGGTPTLNSILTQALLSNDSENIKLIFENKDEEIINATVRNMENQNVEKLIEILIKRLELYPNETTGLLMWTDSVIKIKNLFIQSNPRVVRFLKDNQMIFKAKQSVYADLLQIKGRLSMLLEQKGHKTFLSNLMSSSYGVPNILIDEREIIEESKQSTSITIKKSKVKKEPLNKIELDDSFEDLINDDLFEEQANREDDDFGNEDDEEEDDNSKLYDVEDLDDQDDPLNQSFDDENEMELEEEIKPIKKSKKNLKK